MNDVTIRTITREDAPALAEITGEVQALHHEAMPDFFTPVLDDLSAYEAHIRAFMDRGTGYVAEVGGQAVGYLLYVIRDVPHNLFTQPHVSLHIDEMGVKSAFRGRGIGRGLMERVVLDARSLNARSVTLNVFRFNADAVRFYESCGFDARNMTMQLLV